MQIPKNHLPVRTRNFNFKAGYKDMPDEDKKYFDKRIDDFIRYAKERSKSSESKDVFVNGVPAKLDVYDDIDYVVQTEDNSTSATMTIHEYNNALNSLFIPFKKDNGIEIGILYSKGMGAGKYMVKEAVKKSDELGYDGRVAVYACKLISSAGCPVPFYYKLGFVPDNSSDKKLVEKAMKEYDKTGVYNGPDGINMHLSKSKIKEFLD